MQKILITFGTRPEAIKMCPLIIELKERNIFNVVVCVTGQHKEMLNQVLDFFNVKPDYNLNIMKNEQTLFDVSSSILQSFKEVLDIENPDVVLVHGDTTTAFIAPLASFYCKTPVGHVEAGLRSHDIYSPFPEEFNRAAVGIISQYNFVPTTTAKQNLLSEGKNEDSIFITGNTVIDSLKYTVSDDYSHPELDWSKDSRLLLITAHRRENLGESMHNMFRAIRRILDENSDVKAVYPIHMNPKVREIAEMEFSGCDRIHIIEPLDVIDFHNFEANCFMCITDSGGVQEECPHFGKPVLVMRNTTERPEGIEAGTAKLVGVKESEIYNSINLLLNNESEYNKMAKAINPYGDGCASKRISKYLEELL